MTPGQRAYERFHEGCQHVAWAELGPESKVRWEASAHAARKREKKPKAVYPDCFWVSSSAYSDRKPELQHGKRLPDGADWRRRHRVRMADGQLYHPSHVYPTKRRAVAAYLRDLRERVRREDRSARRAKRALAKGEKFAKQVFK